MGEVRYAEVRESLVRRQTAGEFVGVQRSPHQTGRLLTTVKTIVAEPEIVKQIREGQHQWSPWMSRLSATIAVDPHSYLNSDVMGAITEAGLRPAPALLLG
jgi:hypothetical protein